jgi:hypothetical protein
VPARSPACAANLAAQLGRTATDDEVASMLAMSVVKLRKLATYLPPCSQP